MTSPKLFGVEIPFVTHLGFELVFMEGGRSELRYLPRHDHRNRYLRSGMRSRDHDGHHEHHAPDAQAVPGPGFELPPGATFDPDPQQAITQATPAKDKHAP